MLHARQAANQPIALQASQMSALQQLLAVQARAEALDLARDTATEESARVRRERFLGDARAYTSTRVRALP